jgi:DNA-directed RNA polymerase
MSTKPSFDNIYEDEDEVDSSGDEYQLKWIKQASLNNYSKYDNYLQYDSNNDEGSLLDLMNAEDDAPAIKKQLDERVESMLMLLNEDTGELLDVEHITQSSRAELGGEENLLDLLLAPDVYEEEEPPLSNLLNEETKDDTLSSKYQDLQRLQLQLEIESTQEAVDRYLLELKSARDRSDHATLPGIRRALGSWYEQLTDAIELEQWLYLNGDNRTSTSSQLNLDESDEDAKPKTVKDRTIYGPLLCLLPARKVAVLLAHTALTCTVHDRDLGSKVVVLALNIAQALESEVNVSRALRVRAREKRGFGANPTSSEIDDNGQMLNDQTTVGDNTEDEEVDYSSEGIAVDRWVYTASHLKRFLDEISRKGGSSTNGQQSLKKTGRVQPAIVRKRCQEILLAEGFDSTGENKKPLSMQDFVDWDPVLKVKLGAALIRLLLDHATFSSDSNRKGPAEPAFSYSRKKTGEMKFNGFISIHPELLHLTSTNEISSDSTFIPPRAMANTKCQPMVVPPKDWTDVRNGGYELLKVDFMRTRHCKTQKVSLLQHIFEDKLFERLLTLFDLFPPQGRNSQR